MTRVVAALWALVCGGGYAAISLVRFHRFALSSYDNAIFEQAVQGYAHVAAPVSDIKGAGFVLLGDHFSPVLAVLGPVYRLVPAAETLLVAQAVLIAVSVYVVTALALRQLGRWAAGALVFAYGLSFGLQAAVEADFHAVAFGVPLLALAGAAFVERRYDRVVWWSLPLLLVKEDLGLTVAAVGLALALVGERRRGTRLAVIGAVAFLVTVIVVVPAFNPDGTYAYTSSLGGDRGPFTALFEAPGRKMLTVVMTFAVGGLASLASPWAWLVVPTFAYRFAGDNPFYWGTDFHYSMLLMPIVAVAAIDAIRRRPRLRVAGLAAAAFTIVTLVGSPLAMLVGSVGDDRPARAAAAERVLAEIPDGALVESDIGLMTHLVTDHRVTWIGTPNNPVPDWVLLDVGSGLGSPQDVAGYARQRYGTPYTVVDRDGGFVLARRDPQP